MKVQTYKPDFAVSSEPKTFPGNFATAERATAGTFGDVITDSMRTIGSVAHMLLMIAIVGAHPVWVMWFLVVFLNSR